MVVACINVRTSIMALTKHNSGVSKAWSGVWGLWLHGDRMKKMS
uniref:Uncharacterized protein n=1 Tax=Anguilla anguilla TaxID=7936 RepID=A0A0E9Q7W2_ANGAN